MSHFHFLFVKWPIILKSCHQNGVLMPKVFFFSSHSSCTRPYHFLYRRYSASGLFIEINDRDKQDFRFLKRSRHCHVFLNCAKKSHFIVGQIWVARLVTYWKNLKNRSKTKKVTAPRSWPLFFPSYDLRGFLHIATPFKPLRRYYLMSLCMLKSCPEPWLWNPVFNFLIKSHTSVPH